MTASSLFSSKQLKWEYSELKTGTAMILEGVLAQLVKTNNEQKIITKGFILNLSSREMAIQKIKHKLIYLPRHQLRHNQKSILSIDTNIRSICRFE